MPKMGLGAVPAEPDFAHSWVRMPEVQTLLVCAQKLNTRIGIRGGVVRNFLMGLRSKTGAPGNLVDLIDPFSDVDCVLDDEFNWPSVAAAISSNLPFAGYHRWEVESRNTIQAHLDLFEKLPSDRLVIWHDGYDDNLPQISLEGLGKSTEQILKEIDSPVWADQGRSIRVEDPWTAVLDALRLARFSLQSSTPDLQVQMELIPNRATLERLVSGGISERTFQRNLLRFNLAILDIITTSDSLDTAKDYLQHFWSLVPQRLRDIRTILGDLVNTRIQDFGFIGALVYKQPPSESLRCRLLFDRKNGGTRRGIDSLIPWTPLWSILNADDDCCRHTDFRNGVAVLSWRPTKPETLDSRSKTIPFDFAPVAQVDLPTLYRRLSKDIPLLLPIPGFVRTGPSVTLRMDHAYPAAYLGKNLKFFAGLVQAKESN
jgi:hypothetical protein